MGSRRATDLGGSVQSAFVGSEGIAEVYDDDGLGEKCRKESALSQGSQSCHASLGVQSCHRPPGQGVTVTTVSRTNNAAVFDQQLRPEQKDPLFPDRPNSIVSETCLVGCVPGPSASRDNFRVLPSVSDDDNMISLTGYTPAGQVIRCLTSPSPAPVGASEDTGGILCGTSSQVDWSVGSASTNRTSGSGDPAEHDMWNLILELFCHAEIGNLMEAFADEMVLATIALSCHFALDVPWEQSENPKCVDVATFDMLQDGTDVTAGEQCNTMGAVATGLAPAP